MFVSALVMIKEKVIKMIPTEITNWFANWNDDRKFHNVAGMLLHLRMPILTTSKLIKSLCTPVLCLNHGILPLSMTFLLIPEPGSNILSSMRLCQVGFVCR